MFLTLAGFGGTNGGGWHIVHNPIMVIPIQNVFLEHDRRQQVKSFLAEFLTVDVRVHVDGVQRGLYFVSGEEIAQGFGCHCGSVDDGLAEWEAVVWFGYLVWMDVSALTFMAILWPFAKVWGLTPGITADVGDDVEDRIGPIQGTVDFGR